MRLFFKKKLTRRWILSGRFLLVVVGLFAAVVVSATALALSTQKKSTGQNSSDISRGGTPIDAEQLPKSELAFLSDLRVDPSSVKELTNRSGVRYYVGTSSNGALCYITGVVLGPGPHFGIGSCVRTDKNRPDPTQPRFPSDESPILDRSVFHKAPGARAEIVRFSGFAADNVAAIGVVDTAGTTHWAEAIDNVYSGGGWAPIEAAAIVARDSSGREIYRFELP